MVTKSLPLALALFLGSASAASCVNNATFVYLDDDKYRSCRNIRIHEPRRQVMCLVPEVATACPQACGLCCEDDDTYKFPDKNRDVMHTCDWILHNDKRKAKRIQRYCIDRPLKPYKGRTIRDACPVSCDFCFSAITSAPTSTQEPSASPTLTQEPSGVPTRPPSPQPSPSPSDTPSRTPSDSPSLKPSSDPSDEPSLQPSDSPSLQPSDSPSDEPSGNPTKSIKPSASPSNKPTLLPSIAHTACNADSTTFKFQLKFNTTKLLGCAWLTKNPKNETDTKRLNKYCPDADIATNCCASCS